MSSTLPVVTDLLEECSKAGLRKTTALRACLDVLASADRPLTLQEIAGNSNFNVDCDPATVYRLITRLEEHRIVRRIGFHSRAAHYCLRQGNHQDYLICRDCGTIAVLDLACPVEHLENEIADSSGFTEIEHELEFFGLCQSCQN
ncbi:MAG: transcriptional repressor [Verrucomicrobiales bacterium]|nr:transcriptional repressor [Verrucomicrobiales bacterium]